MIVCLLDAPFSAHRLRFKLMGKSRSAAIRSGLNNCDAVRPPLESAAQI